MLPKPFSFIVMAQASISGSASCNYAIWNKSLFSMGLGCLICKLGIITPPYEVVLEIEPYQETQSSRVTMLAFSRSTPNEPGKAGVASRLHQATGLLPAPPSCTKSVPGCQGNLYRLPCFSERSLPWSRGLLAFPSLLVPQGGSSERACPSPQGWQEVPYKSINKFQADAHKLFGLEPWPFSAVAVKPDSLR